MELVHLLVSGCQRKPHNPAARPAGSFLGDHGSSVAAVYLAWLDHDHETLAECRLAVGSGVALLRALSEPAVLPGVVHLAGAACYGLAGGGQSAWGDTLVEDGSGERAPQRGLVTGNSSDSRPSPSLAGSSGV